MQHCSGPFRFVLTIVLAMAIPFCCCKLNAFLVACSDCETSTDSLLVTGASSFNHTHVNISCHQSELNPHQVVLKLTNTNNEHSKPPNGTEHNNKHGDGNCACGNHDSKMLTAIKSSVEFSTPVLIAVLPWQELSPLTLDLPTRVQFHHDWAQIRPPTSLLRLHCALIV